MLPLGTKEQFLKQPHGVAIEPLASAANFVYDPRATGQCCQHFSSRRPISLF